MNKKILNNFHSENKRKKFIKYILFSLILFISVKYISKKNISDNENLLICVIGMITFTLLDYISPSIKIS
jgi:hypothetical protein